MVRSAKPSRKMKTPQPVAAPMTDSAPPDLVEHPDGYYWQDHDSHDEFGPFESDALARADRDAVGDEALARGETSQEAVHETGTDEWIDAETGDPAEGDSPPYLREH